MQASWPERLDDQLTWHWENHVWPRLGGMSDDEYLWEPAPNAWSLRPATDGLTIDWRSPEPTPPPVTTIAWRMAHLIIDVFGKRAHRHFGGPVADYATFPFSATSAGALAQLDAAYRRWVDGASTLDDAALDRPVGDREPGWEPYPFATLVLHVTREAIHHGAEILLLRDLYRVRAEER
jgi:hypothetical protein